MRFNTLVIAFAALLLVGCSKSDDKTPVHADRSVGNCIGSWRLTSFCNLPTDIDIYITIRNDGTFILYQRNADYTPVRFPGSYTFDAESYRFSGRYDDGTAWAASYILEYADGESMIWVNAADESEISVYTRSDIPASMLGGAGRKACADSAPYEDMRFFQMIAL